MAAYTLVGVLVKNATGVELRDNTITGGQSQGMAIEDSSDITVQDNTLGDYCEGGCAAEVGLHVGPGVANISVVSNIFFNNSKGDILSDSTMFVAFNQHMQSLGVILDIRNLDAPSSTACCFSEAPASFISSGIPGDTIEVFGFKTNNCTGPAQSFRKILDPSGVVPLDTSGNITSIISAVTVQTEFPSTSSASECLVLAPAMETSSRQLPIVVIVFAVIGAMLLLLALLVLLRGQRSKGSEIAPDLYNDNPVVPSTFVVSYGQEDIEVREELGRGQFGVVHSGVIQSTRLQGTRVAVKSMSTDSPSSMVRAFIEEGRLMSQLKHPNLIKLHGMSLSSANPFLVLEFMENGCLLDLLRDKKEQMIPHLDGFCSGIASGMQYLESERIIHRFSSLYHQFTC